MDITPPELQDIIYNYKHQLEFKDTLCEIAAIEMQRMKIETGTDICLYVWPDGHRSAFAINKSGDIISPQKTTLIETFVLYALIESDQIFLAHLSP